MLGTGASLTTSGSAFAGRGREKGGGGGLLKGPSPGCSQVHLPAGPLTQWGERWSAFQSGKKEKACHLPPSHAYSRANLL